MAPYLPTFRPYFAAIGLISVATILLQAALVDHRLHSILDFSSLYRKVATRVSAVGSQTLHQEYPWSQAPTCVERENPSGPESLLCVYTDEKFAGGRGLSVITTPDLIHALLSNIRQSDKNHVKLPMPLSYETHNATDERGRKVLATEDIEWNVALVYALPVILEHSQTSELSESIYERLLEVAIRSLPLATQLSVDEMSEAYRPVESPLSQVMSQHAGFYVNFDGHQYNGLYPDMAYLNHDCKPNALVRIYPARMEVLVISSTWITAKEEITISYLPKSPDLYMQPTMRRQQIIRDELGFDCSCAICLRND